MVYHEGILEVVADLNHGSPFPLNIAQSFFLCHCCLSSSKPFIVPVRFGLDSTDFALGGDDAGGRCSDLLRGSDGLW